MTDPISTNPFRLQLRLEGWPAREEKTAFISDEKHPFVDHLFRYTPPSYRLGVGILSTQETQEGWSAPDWLRFIKHVDMEFLTGEWQGKDDFGVASSLGFQPGSSPFIPTIRPLRFSMPFDLSDRETTKRFLVASELYWTIVNNREWRTDVLVQWNWSQSKYFNNAFALGAAISFGEEANTLSKPAFVNYRTPPPTLEITHKTLKRKNLDLKESKGASKTIVIVADLVTWERLQREHGEVVKNYLVSIAEDFEELEGQDVSFEIYSGNWEEVLKYVPIDDENRVRLKQMEQIQGILEEHRSNQELLGTLLFGPTPSLNVRVWDQEFTSPTDRAYQNPGQRLESDNEKPGVIVARRSYSGFSFVSPTGRFPADPDRPDGLKMAVQLMKNAIAYRHGENRDGSKETSEEVAIYSAQLNRQVAAEDPRRKAREEIAPTLRFIDPVEASPLDTLIKRQEEILEVLEGGEEKPPAHALLFNDHGGNSSISITHAPQTSEELAVTWEGGEHERIEASDLKFFPANTNFIHFESCQVALHPEEEDSFLHSLAVNGGIVGAAAYTGYEYGYFQLTMEWAALVDLELRMPPSLGLRVFDSRFMHPVDFDEDSWTYQYFGDPFVRFSPLAYRKDLSATPSETRPVDSEYNDNRKYEARLLSLLNRSLKENDVDAIRALLPFFRSKFYTTKPPIRDPRNDDEKNSVWRTHSADRLVEAKWRRIYPFLARHGIFPEELQEELNSPDGSLLNKVEYFIGLKDYASARKELERRPQEAPRRRFFSSRSDISLYQAMCDLREDRPLEKETAEKFEQMVRGKVLNKTYLAELMAAEYAIRQGNIQEGVNYFLGLYEEPFLNAFPEFLFYYNYLVATAYLLSENPAKRKKGLGFLKDLTVEIHEGHESHAFFLPHSLKDLKKLVETLESLKELPPKETLIDILF